MKKRPTLLLGTILILIVSCQAADTFKNYWGWGDTSQIAEFAADSLKYSRTFTLGDPDGLRLIVMCDDTASAGFASDSVAFYFGYQTGCPMLDSSGSVDTLWDVPIILDTIEIDSFGVYKSGTSSAAGVPTIAKNNVDTLQIDGFAVKSMRFQPYYDVLIRYYFKGLTGNSVGYPVYLRIQHIKRIGAPVREMK